MRATTVLCTGLLVTLAGCSSVDRERARRKADEAGEKTATAVRKLGTEAEAKAKELNKKLGESLDGQHPGEIGSTSSAEQKLDRAGAIAREKGHEAANKLDRAGMLAKVKAKLTNDVGLSTIANVDVDVNGTVVTLNGSVSSADQKQLAERAVSGVDGVTRVVNNLSVQP